MKRGFKQVAFTLALLSLISLAAMVFAPRKPHYPRKPHSRHAECSSNLEFIGHLCEKFFAEKGRYPGELAELVPTYTSAIPGCRAKSQEHYKIEYRTSNKGIEIWCEEGKLLRHQWAGYWEYRSGPGGFPGKVLLVR